MEISLLDFDRKQMIRHAINTGDATPIRQHLRRIAPYRRKETQKLLQDMSKKDVIKSSTSPWASPIILVRKKDMLSRFCVDYILQINITCVFNHVWEKYSSARLVIYTEMRHKSGTLFETFSGEILQRTELSVAVHFSRVLCTCLSHCFRRTGLL